MKKYVLVSLGLLFCLGLSFCLNFLFFTNIPEDRTPPYVPPATPSAIRDHAEELEAKYNYLGAIAQYQQAYLLDKAANTDACQEDAALDLNKIGNCYRSISQYPKALEFFQQELALARQMKDKVDEASTLDNIGEVNSELSHYDKAIDFYQQALPIFREVKNRDGEAGDLSDLGLAYDSLSQYDKAIGFYQQALVIFREVKDRNSEATALNNLGEAYGNLSQYEKAIDFFQQAMVIHQEIKDRDGEATTLGNLGGAYDSLSQYDKAIGFYQQALVIFREVKDRNSEATALNNLGEAYDNLSQYEKAIGFFQQALPILREVKDRNMEATTLNNLGAAYNNLSQHDKAIDFHQQALVIFREVKDRDGEAATLNNLGGAYNSLSQYDKAIDLYQQALPTLREVKDRDVEATTLTNLGEAYDGLSQYEKALDYYGQALPLQRQVGNRGGEAATLNNLMFAWKSLDRPGVAVFYGKQSVNVIQSIRADISPQDKESQKSYLAANADTYRTLADLLISQGRLGEAEAVLALLKEAEYRDFNGTDRALAASPTAPVPLTTGEAQWQAEYAGLGDTLERLNQQATELAKLDTRTPAQEAQYRTLTAKQDKADAAFQQFLDRLARHFQDAVKGNAAVLTVQAVPKLQNALTRWARGGTRVAALYTVEADTQYAVILVTPNGSRPGATAITAADLNKKIEAFRQALTDKTVDPRPLGQELYKILVGPVEKDLNAYRPQVVMWSLDGLIRYLPVAALYDGKGYLVERWQNTLFDPASLPDLDQTRTDWRRAKALGYGVSLEHHVKTATQDDEFPALTHVPEELDGIIHDPKLAGASGVLPGQVRMDALFTRADTLDALRAHTHPVVHIATHFRFDAAQAEQSYLLLGDGGQISLADLRRPGLFRDVDLLTLSACSTAMGQANADGKEVDSLGRTAEDDGAQAVIASLWNVSDASTALLMRTLYRRLQSGPSVTRAAALQAAQLSLLRGSATLGGTAKRSTEAVAGRSETGGLPPFVPDPKAPYAHPFYWAPFVLIGNWR